MVRNNNYEELVQQVLESQFKVRFEAQQEYRAGKMTIAFDLVDVNQAYFVDIVPDQKKIDVEPIIGRVHEQLKIITSNSKAELPTFMLVFSNIIDNVEREEVVNAIGGLTNDISSQVYDLINIIDLAIKHDIDYTAFIEDPLQDQKSQNAGQKKAPSTKQTAPSFDNLDFGESIKAMPDDDASFSKSSFFTEPENTSSTEQKTAQRPNPNPTPENLPPELEKRNFFLADHYWNGTDQLPRFMEENLWENPPGAIDRFVVNSALDGDLIFAKSRAALDSDTSLVLVAVGVVMGNTQLSHRIAVQWSLFDERITVSELEEYLRPFTQVRPQDRNRLITSLQAAVPDFQERIDTLEALIAETSDTETPPETEETPQKTKDKIPFHLDNVETIDKLNRKPVAKSLARLINQHIFDQDEMNHAFMVHLQGEWGSGKSTFLNLIEEHLTTKDRKWMVIKYNAWQNQHISPPWWSFINQVYRQSKGAKKLNIFKKVYLKFKENYRRVLRYSSVYKGLTFVISLVLIVLLVNYWETIFTTISKLLNPEAEGLKSSDPLGSVQTVLLTLSAIVGVIVSLAKFFATPILMSSSKDAISFLERAANPMSKIKAHFESLVKDVNSLGFEMAIFIDDIDRCNGEYTVELLEGIQTLFKDHRVLYIVAGDTQWITSCFENKYKEFASVAQAQGQHLGQLFLEKAFQLSVRMPEVSEESKRLYWKEIIGDTLDIQVELETNETPITEDVRNQIKERLVTNYNQNQNDPQERSTIEREFNITQQEATDIAIEALDEDTENVKHLLISFHHLISPNPRSIKRLANNYSMYRNTLLAEQVDFTPGNLFRWLLLDDKYPSVIQYLVTNNTLGTLPTFLEEHTTLTETQTKDLHLILHGREELAEQPLQMEQLRSILRK